MDMSIKVRQSLENIWKWYRCMINWKKNRLIYEYDPIHQISQEENCPIRNMGNIWDMSLLKNFLQKDDKDVEQVIKDSIDNFATLLKRWNGQGQKDMLIFDSKKLGESSSIAHSAFMILCLSEIDYPKNRNQIANELANGIIAQQRSDGSFKINFEREKDHGIEMYSGEAMLALLKHFKLVSDPKYLESVERAFPYYRTFYENGKVRDDMLPFFSNWQSQAFKLLFQHTKDENLKMNILLYVVGLFDELEDGQFFEEIRRYPLSQATVAVACALEGLCDAFFLLPHSDTLRRGLYSDAMNSCLLYLLQMQRKEGSGAGGFGHSPRSHIQRLDVTGHVASAFMKFLDLLSQGKLQGTKLQPPPPPPSST